MYAAAWWRLPGPVWLRLLIALAVVAAVVTALFLLVFPLVDAVVTPSDPVVSPATR